MAFTIGVEVSLYHRSRSLNRLYEGRKTFILSVLKKKIILADVSTGSNGLSNVLQLIKAERTCGHVFERAKAECFLKHSICILFRLSIFNLK